MNMYLGEVLNAHTLIQDWLGKGTGELQDLLCRFSPRFSMITPAGTCMDHEALRRLFTAQRKGRPGLAIHIDSMTLLEEWSHGAIVAYRERQHSPQTGTTVRWSTAVLALENGVLVWRHLHETWEGNQGRTVQA